MFLKILICEICGAEKNCKDTYSVCLLATEQRSKHTYYSVADCVGSFVLGHSVEGKPIAVWFKCGFEACNKNTFEVSEVVQVVGQGKILSKAIFTKFCAHACNTFTSQR